MEVNLKNRHETEISSLEPGDVCKTSSDSIYMIVDASNYIREDKCFKVVVVNLRTGVLDRFSPHAHVEKINLIANEKED